MGKFFDENGKEVEAFSKEELDAQKKTALEEYTKANPSKEQELKDAQKKIEDLNKALEQGGMSEGQKERLKKDKEEAEKKVGEITEKFTKEISDLKTSIFGGKKKSLINSLAKDDETRKKIEAKYDTLMKTGDYANDEEGIARAVAEAATIVTGNKPKPGFFDGVSGAGERGNGGTGDGTQVESEASKAQRKLLGISDEDAKKFAPKPKEGTI